MSSRAEKLSFILAIRKNVSVEMAFDVLIKERKERKVCHGNFGYFTSLTGLFWRKVAGYTGTLYCGIILARYQTLLFLYLKHSNVEKMCLSNTILIFFFPLSTSNFEIKACVKRVSRRLHTERYNNPPKSTLPKPRVFNHGKEEQKNQKQVKRKQ